jgi:hypothetical protein
LIKNFCLLDEIILGLKMQIGPIEKEGTPLDKVVFFAFKEGIEILNKIASAHCGRRQFERQWKKVSLLADKIDIQTKFQFVHHQSFFFGFHSIAAQFLSKTQRNESKMFKMKFPAV